MLPQQWCKACLFFPSVVMWFVARLHLWPETLTAVDCNTLSPSLFHTDVFQPSVSGCTQWSADPETL